MKSPVLRHTPKHPVRRPVEEKPQQHIALEYIAHRKRYFEGASLVVGKATPWQDREYVYHLTH